MATRFAHKDAARLAGSVFGEILQRNADPGGYAYVLDCLESGSKSLQDIVVEFISSDEFIDRFVLAHEPSSAANLVNILLLGEPLSNGQLELARHEIVRVGLRAYAEQIVASEEYQRRIGPDRMPSPEAAETDAAAPSAPTQDAPERSALPTDPAERPTPPEETPEYSVSSAEEQKSAA